MAVHALDPILREGAIRQLYRHPEIELRTGNASGPGTVVLLVEDVLNEAVLNRLRRLVHSEGSRAVLVVRSMGMSELLDVIECGVSAIVWRHEANETRLTRAVLAAAHGGGDLPADLLRRLLDQAAALHRDAVGPVSLRPDPASG
ncbi:hypothetical protein AB0D47_37260 [Streptomyces sp. NPDC048376]|uniref:hypothetical protein n=1 Tax=unclassified Streptomyces TaxID=2593676 RepID=UPI0029BFB63C|nr:MULTISPECIES: hypothetical protein [unclassified Streptomyces]